MMRRKKERKDNSKECKILLSPYGGVSPALVNWQSVLKSLLRFYLFDPINSFGLAIPIWLYGSSG